MDECEQPETNICDPFNGFCINRPKTDLPFGYVCLCNIGYELSSDGFTCIDQNECR